LSSFVLPASRLRDLSVLELDQHRLLLVACDSVGSIGPKPHDSYPATAEATAHFATRVPLLEVICAGGNPELIVDTLGVELEPTGTRMIEEVRRIAASIGLGPERVTGSTEDNVPTVATGIGVTIVATADRTALRPGRAQDGDAVVCLGVPISAPHDEVTVGDARMISIERLAEILNRFQVHDALPVGSKGVRYEAEQLATSAGLRFDPADPCPIELTKSGGPSSCVLVAVEPGTAEDLRAAAAGTPACVVGHLTGEHHA
jgi:hypothetical protein